MFRLYALIGVVVFLLASHAGMFFYGKMQGKNEIKMIHYEAAIKAEKDRDNVEREVITLDRPALRQRYCKWVRDDQQACLQADIPIRS